MAFREFIQPSPNFDATHRHEKLGVCFHHSVAGFEQTLERMSQPASQVSYHCLIAPDGTRCCLVEDNHIAWHAGASHFLGRNRANDFLLGCAFAGDTYAQPLTEEQITSALEWLGPRWTAQAWTIDRMTDHRQIAPGRKDDLNPLEWQRLQAAIRTGIPD